MMLIELVMSIFDMNNDLDKIIEKIKDSLGGILKNCSKEEQDELSIKICDNFEGFIKRCRKENALKRAVKALSQLNKS